MNHTRQTLDHVHLASVPMIHPAQNCISASSIGSGSSSVQLQLS